MGHGEEPEKWDAEDDVQHFPASKVISRESATDEAIDAEANIEPSMTAKGSTTKETSDPGPPPNGGFAAWLQVAGSFFLFFNAWPNEAYSGNFLNPPVEPHLFPVTLANAMGTVNAFGVFQTYYEANLLANKSPSEISWIGSIQAFLLLMIGVLTGPAYDAGYFRALITTGAFLISFGFMMLSLCEEYWQCLLAQAFVIGIGNGCLFIPSVAILPQYFSTRKAIANGIAATGSSIGGVIYPIVFRQLYPRIGFPWTVRVLGFISLATCAFSVLVMRPRIFPKHKRHLTDFPAFKEVPYTVFNIAMFFGFIGFYGPVYYIGPEAISSGITDVNLGFYLLPILNSASVAGRIIPNFLTDKIGPLNVLTPAATISGILALCWIGISNLGGTIAFALLYGFFTGGFVSIPPVALVTLTPDMRKLGTRMGQSFFISALGLLIGSPVSGAIVSKTGSYVGLKLFSGLALIVTGVLVAAARISKVGWKVKIRA